jgi:membrane-associated protein
MIDSLIELFRQVYNVQWLINTFGLIGMTFIVFAETGLLIGFFLPGDSLLVTCGILTSMGVFQHHPLFTALMLSLAAIFGDATGFWIGAKSGPHLFKRPKSFFFNPKHLQTTHEFYERHGGKTIIIARFVPIVRTFAPVVAGIGKMHYGKFFSYNVFGGIGWVFSMIFLGYYMGNFFRDKFGINIEHHIDKVIILIIFVSLIPIIIHYFMEKKRKTKEAAGKKD